MPRRSVKRETKSWSTTLKESGLLQDGTRIGRGHASVAADGHMCRSILERSVEDFFIRMGTHHETEPDYPYHRELNPFGYRADWLLDDGTLVEAAGMMAMDSYRLKIEKKAQLAQELGLGMIVILPSDVPRLNEILAPWVRPQT